MNDCIFCDIIKDSADIHVWSNEVAVAFKTISPQAPIHVLVVPREHIANIDGLESQELAGALVFAAREVAHQFGLKGEWKMRINNGEKAGQTIPHLHVHMLGGADLGE